MRQAPAGVVGIAWYAEDDYSHILEVMADSHLLPPTYEQWRKKAEEQVKRDKTEGLAVVRVHIDPDRFRAWCRDLCVLRDAHARALFVGEAAARIKRKRER